MSKSDKEYLDLIEELWVRHLISTETRNRLQMEFVNAIDTGDSE